MWVTVCKDVPLVLLLSTASTLKKKNRQTEQPQIYTAKLVGASFIAISLGRCQGYPYTAPSKRWIPWPTPSSAWGIPEHTGYDQCSSRYARGHVKNTLWQTLLTPLCASLSQKREVVKMYFPSRECRYKSAWNLSVEKCQGLNSPENMWIHSHRVCR